MHVRNQNYFRREIISQDSELERAMEPKFSNNKLPTRGPCNLTLIPWANDVNSQADIMIQKKKGGRGQTLWVSTAGAHKNSRLSLGLSVDEN